MDTCHDRSRPSALEALDRGRAPKSNGLVLDLKPIFEKETNVLPFVVYILLFTNVSRHLKVWHPISEIGVTV